MQKRCMYTFLRCALSPVNKGMIQNLDISNQIGQIGKMSVKISKLTENVLKFYSLCLVSYFFVFLTMFENFLPIEITCYNVTISKEF